MKPHIVPFENRWTNGERAWHWHSELERLGVPNVRMMFSEYQTRHIAMSLRLSSMFLPDLYVTG